MSFWPMRSCFEQGLVVQVFYNSVEKAEADDFCEFRASWGYSSIVRHYLQSVKQASKQKWWTDKKKNPILRKQGDSILRMIVRVNL